MTTPAMAPAPPATMKLVALHAKSSRQTVHAERPVDSPIAPAIRPVFTAKYTAIAPTSGRSIGEMAGGAIVPPSAPYAAADAAMVTISAATLNAVRYAG